MFGLDKNRDSKNKSTITTTSHSEDAASEVGSEFTELSPSHTLKASELFRTDVTWRSYQNNAGNISAKNLNDDKNIQNGAKAVEQNSPTIQNSAKTNNGDQAKSPNSETNPPSTSDKSIEVTVDIVHNDVNRKGYGNDDIPYKEMGDSAPGFNIQNVGKVVEQNSPTIQNNAKTSNGDQSKSPNSETNPPSASGKSAEVTVDNCKNDPVSLDVVHTDANRQGYGNDNVPCEEPGDSAPGFNIQNVGKVVEQNSPTIQNNAKINNGNQSKSPNSETNPSSASGKSAKATVDNCNLDDTRREVAYASVTGKSHEDDKIPCDDACYFAQSPNGKVVAGCVCDGAGSRIFSKFGASETSRLIAVLLADNFDVFLKNPAFAKERLLKKFWKHLNKIKKEHIKNQLLQIKQFEDTFSKENKFLLQQFKKQKEQIERLISASSDVQIYYQKAFTKLWRECLQSYVEHIDQFSKSFEPEHFLKCTESYCNSSPESKLIQQFKDTFSKENEYLSQKFKKQKQQIEQLTPASFDVQNYFQKVFNNLWREYLQPYIECVNQLGKSFESEHFLKCAESYCNSIPESELIQQFACTAVAFAIRKNGDWIALHIGDGGIVGRDQDGKLTTISKPENGEYGNVTYFVTNPDAVEHLRVVRSSDPGVPEHICDALLFSDGSETRLLKNKTFEPAPACNSLIDKPFEYEDHNKAMRVIIEQHIKPHTSDDCSLLAIRTQRPDDPVKFQ